MSLDLSADYLLFDDPVTVQYAAKTADGVWAAPVAVNYCQRQAVTKTDLTTNGSLLTKVAAVFHLWRANLGGVTPKKADKLGQGGSVWVVESVDVMDRDANGPQRYRLVTAQSTGAQTL